MHRNSIYKELALDKFQVGATLRKEATRDYDKEPIVIKNPYEFFLANLFFFSHTGTFFILGTYAGYAGYVQFSEIKNVNIGFFGFLGFFLVFWGLHIVATFYYYIIKNKCETKFTNKTIEFIINGEVKRVKNLSDLIPFERTFNLRVYAPIATIFMHLIIIFAVIMGEIMGAKIFWFFIAYHIICFCLNFLFKLIFHLILGGNLKEFSLFPAFTIYHYEVLASAFSRVGSAKWNDMRGKFHMIYIIKHQDYLDLQKYFSNKKHINLNSVKKSFLAI